MTLMLGSTFRRVSDSMSSYVIKHDFMDVPGAIVMTNLWLVYTYPPSG